MELLKISKALASYSTNPRYSKLSIMFQIQRSSKGVKILSKKFRVEAKIYRAKPEVPKIKDLNQLKKWNIRDFKYLKKFKSPKKIKKFEKENSETLKKKTKTKTKKKEERKQTIIWKKFHNLKEIQRFGEKKIKNFKIPQKLEQNSKI